MRRRTSNRNPTGAAMAALVVFLSCTHGSATAQEGQPEADTPVVGLVTLSGRSEQVTDHLLPFVGRVLDWAGPRGAGWSDVAESLGETGVTAAGWSVLLADSGLTAEPLAGDEPTVAQSIAFDLLFDCNMFRSESPQPFSHTARGRALDALAIDNARRARLTGVYTDQENPGDLTIVMFTESRSVPRGRWYPLPLATVRMAETRGDDTPPLPVEIDMSERWGGIVYSLADLALGLDPASQTHSLEQRMRGWGLAKSGALRSIASGFEGKAWVWEGGTAGGVVSSLPLGRGWTDRRIADALRAVFARRLAWNRGDDGRSTGTLALIRENRPPAEGDRTLSLRFISIADRPTLTIATDAEDLNDVAETLADVIR